MSEEQQNGQSQEHLRVQELWEAFQSVEWDNIKRELLICRANAMKPLLHRSCGDRSYYAGKASAYDDILLLEHQTNRNHRRYLDEHGNREKQA